MYADDLVIVANSKTQLIRSIKRIKSWGAKLGMMLNEKKSVVFNMDWKKTDKDAGIGFEGIKVL